LKAVTRLFAPGVARQGAKALGFALALQAVAAVACAAPTYTVVVSPGADLGTVTSAAAGDSVFRVDPTAGSVTQVSGSATRSANTSTRAMVTVSCAAQVAGDCAKTLNVRLGTVGSPTGRARALTRLTFVMGTAQLAGGPGAPGSASFTIGAVGANSSKTFFVGADLGVAGDDSGLPTGLAESDFFAFVAESPATPTAGGIGRFTATVIRSIAISKTSDLVFGTIAQPASGSGLVTIDPNSGARTTLGAVGLSSPTPSRATFSITGEGGQAFSVSVPATFQMNGPAPITVTTTSSVTGAPLLSGVLGSQGSFTLGVGGSAPINSTTPAGDYTGSFTVTVAYN
jgi:hypothetical protein